MTTPNALPQVASTAFANVGHSLLETLRDGIAATYATLMFWNERQQQRNHLMALDERLLRDIGLNRDQAVQEALKPFWRS